MRNRAFVLVLPLALVATMAARGQAPPEPTPAPTPVAPSAGASGTVPPLPPPPAAPSATSPSTPGAPGTGTVPQPSPASPPPAGPKVYRISTAAGPIKIDGVLEEAAWERAERIDLAFETFPGNNLPARVQTQAQVAYDTENLYVAFRAQDPSPGKIRAHLSDRDKAFSDDFVGIVLDSFNDERRGFEFFVNPLGVQMDLSINDVGGSEDETWDALWNAAGRITPSGYTVEMAIPFTSLRFKRAGKGSINGEQTWGMDLLRVYPRDQRFILRLQQQDRNRNCYICQISKLEGLVGISPGRNIELDPTVTSQRTDEGDFPSGDLEGGDVDVEPGLTARWGMTPNLTLNAAINPDFSQVEADVAQLDVNTQFALFFPEKRPLFLEGADFFQTPLTAVYTRTVADPEWALKLTGKESKSALGFFVSQDEITNLIIPGSESSSLASIDEENHSGVLRYRYDIGKNSTVGALYAGREGDGNYRNHVFGADAYFRVSPRDTIQAQFLGSRTRYPASIVADFDQPAGSFDDRAFYVDYRHNTRNWFWFAEYADVGPEFRADSGFLPQVGYRRPELGLERIWWGDKGDWYSRLFAGGNWDRTQAPGGPELEEEIEGYVGGGGPLQSYMVVGGGYRDRFFNGSQFSGHKFLFAFFEIRPVGDFYFSIDTAFGDQVDFANTREGDRVLLIPSVRWNLGRHLKLELDHTFETLEVQGGRLFEANLSQLRAIYQFDIRTFLRAILQYTDVERNAALYVDEVDPKSQNLFSQLLLAYKINPQTVFFLGYSDTRLGDDRIDLKQVNRTVFVKLGYAWLL